MPMRSPRLHAPLGVFLCLWVAGCSGSEGGRAVTDREAPAARHCFRNEYPFPDDSLRSDVIELSVVIEGDRVTGTYSWLPFFKDRRVGTLQGRRSGGVIGATYAFTQEGIADSVELTISLEPTRAIVQGGPTELGADGAIERVTCSAG